MRQRVLQVLTSLRPGGMERQTLNLVRALRADGRYDVHVAALGADGPLSQELRELAIDDVPRFELSHMYGPSAARHFLRFARLLHHERIDIIHTHDFYTTAFAIPAAFLAGVPIRIGSRRELDVFTPAQRAVERAALRLAVVVLANCAFLRDRLVSEGVPARKVRVLANGIAVDRLRSSEGSAQDLRNRFGVPAGAPLVTMLANLHNKRKDFATFIHTASKVSASRPDAVFLIAGSGDPAAVHELAAGYSPRPHLLTPGLVADVAPLLAASQVVVQTSYSEGVSNAVLEAMAAGVPVVASAVGGMPEVIRDGETGFLVPPGDASAAADRITCLLRGAPLARRLGGRGQEYVLGHFSQERQAAALFDLYAELIHNVRSWHSRP